MSFPSLRALELRLKAARERQLELFLTFVFRANVKLFSEPTHLEYRSEPLRCCLLAPDSSTHISGWPQTHHRAQRQV